MSALRGESLPWGFHPARLAYTGVYGGGALAYHTVLRLRGRVPPEALAERCGKRVPAGLHAPLWIHASSMGEVRVAAGLIDGLARNQPHGDFVWTASTETGYQLARGLAGERTAVIRAPVDLPRALRVFIASARPQALILIETEWWPNQFWTCFRSGVPLFVANGRVSERAARRYGWVRRYIRPLLRGVERFYMRSIADAERLLSLGVDPARVEIPGSLKNVAAEGGPAAREAALPGPPVIVAGCTRPGEEEIVLEAFRQARDKVNDLRLWLAPRHPERFAEVAGLLEQSGVSWAAYSAVPPEELAGAVCAPVVLVDAMGVLAGLYARARVAFVGGSLRPFGGHNPVEPVLAGAPVLFGPYTEEQAEAASALLRDGLAERVQDANSLALAIVRSCESAASPIEWNEKRRKFLARFAATADHVASDILARLEDRKSRFDAPKVC